MASHIAIRVLHFIAGTLVGGRKLARNLEVRKSGPVITQSVRKRFSLSFSLSLTHSRDLSENKAREDGLTSNRRIALTFLCAYEVHDSGVAGNQSASKSCGWGIASKAGVSVHAAGQEAEGVAASPGV